MMSTPFFLQISMAQTKETKVLSLQQSMTLQGLGLGLGRWRNDRVFTRPQFSQEKNI